MGLTTFIPWDQIPDLAGQAYQGISNWVNDAAQSILGPLADPSTFTDPFVDGNNGPAFPPAGSDPDN